MRSETTRWIWLVAGMVMVAGEAAAEDAPRAPAAPGSKYRLAVLEAQPGPGTQQAASLVVAAVREVAAADDRFELVPDKDVAQARALWGEGVMVLTENAEVGSGLGGDGSDTMSRTQACAIGHAAGADRLLLLGGYALELAGPDARLSATLTVINIDSCKVRERARVSAGARAATAEEAMAGARADFARSASEALERLLPLHSAVRAVSRHGGEMEHGARAGVREGQFFAVHRAARPVGHVYVDDVAEDAARVSLVRGTSRLEAGDRLVEGPPVREFEVGLGLTPTSVPRNRDEAAMGVAVGGHLMTYRPVSSNMFVFSLERLGLRDFSRIRGGLEFGRQFRILPRRLFAYARVGVGAVRGQQTLRDADGVALDRGMMVGFELLNALGLRATFGDGLVMHASVSMPVKLYRDTWYYESWSNKVPVPEEMLVYPSPFRALPTFTVAAGWRF